MFGANPFYRVLEDNLRGRDFFVGDLHGHYDLLIRTLDAIGFNRAEDRLISVGDLVDRGPDSPACIELLAQPWFEACLGNHEWMLLAGTLRRDRTAREMQLGNGGHWIEGVPEARLRQWCEIISKRCPLAIEVKLGSRRIGVTHNDVPDNDWRRLRKKASEKLTDRCLWSRQRFMKALDHPEAVPPVRGIDLVVSGHNPHHEPVWAGNQIYIDTLWKSERLTVISAEDLFIRLACRP